MSTKSNIINTSGSDDERTHFASNETANNGITILQLMKPLFLKIYQYLQNVTYDLYNLASVKFPSEEEKHVSRFKRENCKPKSTYYVYFKERIKEELLVGNNE